MSIESRKHQYGRVFGHWQIKEFLGSGSGGKSAVFRLEHTESRGVESALKVISLIEERGRLENFSQERQQEYILARTDCSERAEREVRLMNELQGNTNIVDYLDHTFVDWTDETGFGRDMLIRMEKLTDLRSQISMGKSFSREEILKIGKDICTALSLCHKYGILHRDIKPENVFINKNGSYKLGDFGISRMVSTTSSAVASTGIGTPQYWAPEQTSGKYDVRVDIYSLGLILYELANKNRLPFAQSSYVREEEIHRRLLGETLPPPCNTDATFSQIILKACAFRPQDRYQTAEDFLYALNQVGSSYAYCTMPAQGDASAQTYRTMPAQDDVSAQTYRTMPAQDDASSQTYRTMPAYADVAPHSIQPQQDNQKRSPQRKPRNTKHILLQIIVCLAVFFVAFQFSTRDAEDADPAFKTTESNTTISTTEATAPPATAPAPTTEPDPYAQYAVGDIVRFGSYEQDCNFSNGAEAIAWRVLAKEDGRLMLISEYGLSMQRFNNTQITVTWDGCDLRYWLNETFYYEAFNSDEQARILTTNVTADPNPGYPTYPGPDTQDKVFILSLAELNKYYPTFESRICPATAYAKSQNAFESYGGCWYWLRTPGDRDGTAVSVNTNGTIDHTAGVIGVNGCVRPVIWIEINS